MTVDYPYIQIAGVQSEVDLKNIIDSGIKYIGFPLVLGYHKEDIPAVEVARLCKTYSKIFSPVLITYLTDHSDIINLADFIGCNIVQLHADISIDQLKLLKKVRPDFFIIKSIIISPETKSCPCRLIDSLTPLVDAFISDTFDPNTTASGATGLTHDWNISQQIVQYSSKPLILAGGLSADNVAHAIQHVQPFGVDSHSLVEKSDGLKSPEKLTLFQQRAIAAFKQLD